MHPVHVRPATVEDVPTVSRLIAETPGNFVDPAIFTYPHTQVLVAETDFGIEAVMPIQLTMVVESPGWASTSTFRRIRSLYAIFKHMVALARDKGIREIYFVTSDENIANLAISHGFEEMQHRTFRLRVGTHV